MIEQRTSETSLTALGQDILGVLERITDGFLALDSDLRFTYINANARHLLHLDEVEEVVGRLLYDIFPLVRNTAFEAEYLRAMRMQTAGTVIAFSRTANGWLEENAYPSPDGLSVYFRDITARIEAEQELVRRTKVQQALIDFGRMALGRTDATVLANSAISFVVEQLGFEVAELHEYLRGDGSFRLTAESGWGDDRPARAILEHDAHALLVVENGETLHSEDVRLDGRFGDRPLFCRRELRGAVCALVGSIEEPFAVLTGYTAAARIFNESDISFFESVATTLGETTRVQLTTRRLESTLESVKDGFVACDTTGRITFVNERMARFYGVERGEVLGRRISEYLIHSGDEQVLAAVRKAIADERAQTVEYYSPETEHWFEARIYPWVSGLAIYARDVTRRKTAEMRTQELNAELERCVALRTRQLEDANHELETFAYSVSHDLRAPLRAVDGFSQVIEEEYGERFDEEGRSYLRRVRGAARRMAELIDALLNLARISRAPIIFSELDVSTLLVPIVDDLGGMHPERRVEVIIAPGLRAYGEAALVRAAFENLINNAWKFTRRNPEARIEIGQNEAGEFFVRDNGAGFDMTYANKLFGAFQRLHSADEYEGTGIGLATVARIIHRHGGSIRAEGEVGVGATFYLTLPLEVPSDL